MESLPHTLFFFVIALVVLIAVHEFGHYWVARKLGVKVLRFSLGFGKVIWRRQRSQEDTEFTLSLLPLGGYVRMVDEREGPVEPEDLPFAFNRKSVAARSAIVLAGPLFNLLLAVLIFWITFMWGETGTRPIVGHLEGTSLAAQGGFRNGDEIVSVDGRRTPTWPLAVGGILEKLVEQESTTIDVISAEGRAEQRHLILIGAGLDSPDKVIEKLGLKPMQIPLEPIIEKTSPGSPAEMAGFLPGDRLLKMDGHPVKDWRDWAEYVRARPSTPIVVQVDRMGVHVQLTVIPESLQPETGRSQEGVLRKLFRRLLHVELSEQTPVVPSIGKVGAQVRVPEDVYKSLEVEYRLGPWDALVAATERTFDYSTATFMIAGKMLVGRAAVDNLSGPISIAQLAGRSASLGFEHFLKFLALVSVSLGVLNLLPVPVLDGGHLMFYVFEAIRGKPLSDKTQIHLQQIGMMILMSLMLLGIYLDLGRL